MRLIDTKLAALALGCSTSHVHHLVKTGVLTNHGKRKPWLIDLDEIDKAVKAGRITPNPTGRN